MPTAQLEIVSRASWGARRPTTVTATKAREIFLHHSVGSGMVDKDGDGDKGDDYMRQMQAFHMDSRGWRDLAYNFAIDPDGLEIYEGRGWGVLPGSQCRHNSETWSVVVMGDFRIRRPSDALLSRIAELVAYGRQLGHLPDAPLQGHRDAPVTGDCTGSTCPGDLLYNALPEINSLLEDDMPTADEIRQIVREEAGPSVMSTWVRDPNGVAPGVEGNPLPGPALHFNTVFRGVRNDVRALLLDPTVMDTKDLTAVAKAVNDELAKRLDG